MRLTSLDQYLQRMKLFWYFNKVYVNSMDTYGMLADSADYEWWLRGQMYILYRIIITIYKHSNPGALCLLQILCMRKITSSPSFWQPSFVVYSYGSLAAGDELWNTQMKNYSALIELTINCYLAATRTRTWVKCDKPSHNCLVFRQPINVIPNDQLNDS